MNPKLNKSIFYLITVACVGSLLRPGSAQIRNQIFTGTRPMSMGEAFVAVADDGNAIYWNPAGLARMERIQASFNYSDLFGLGIHSYYASFISRLYFIPPLTDYLTFGVDWFGINTGDEELEFNRNQFNFSLGLKPPKTWPILRDVSFGINRKYLTLKSKLDEITEADAKGWGWDLGILYNLGVLPVLPNGLNFGLMIHDFTGTSIKHKTDVEEEIHRQNIRWGFSYRPFETWPGAKLPISEPLFALDFDDRVHFGLEFWIERILALRMGIQKDLHTNERATLSFGLGLRWKSKTFPEVQVDYALTNSPVLPNTNKQFGGALILRDNPRLIRIQEAHIEDVFVSLFHHYGLPSESVGYVKLKNVSNDTLIARVSFLANRYMKPQAPDTMLIEPAVTRDFPLRAVFEPEIFKAQQGRLTGDVQIIYEYKKSEHTTRTGVDFALYGENYLTWDDPAKAAAFVTSSHPLVDKFVEAARSVRYDTTKARWFTRHHLAEALLLYHALQSYNIDYRPDPVTPFPSLGDFQLDQVAYPTIFLSRKKRFGDCDDLTVLYCSLLQNAGLPSAFISVPGHIFMMFNTGIAEADSLRLALPPSLFVKRNGTLWIPVETTMIPKSTFTEAWAQAAGKYAEAKKDRSLEFVEVAAAQSLYPPVELLEHRDYQPSIPDFSLQFETDLLALEEMKDQYIETLRRDTDTPQGGNRYGVLLAKNDEYGLAKEQFNKILAEDSTFAPAWNNLGNVEFVLGHFDSAEVLYNMVLHYNKYSRGTYLNLAILYQMMKAGASSHDASIYQQKSVEMLRTAAQLLEGHTDQAFALLGFEREETSLKAGLIEGIKKAKEWVDRAFRMYVQKKEIRGVALDRYGAKGRGELDADRGVLLYWSL
jgi:tetratricopeptide (TPR) repeat protein